MARRAIGVILLDQKGSAVIQEVVRIDTGPVLSMMRYALLRARKPVGIRRGRAAVIGPFAESQTCLEARRVSHGDANSPKRSRS